MKLLEFGEFMKMKSLRKHFSLIILFFCSSIIANAQNGQIGHWVDYSPYHNVFDVAEGNGVVFGATKYGLLQYDKDDASILRFSKVEGISDIGVNCLGFNPTTKSFFVGYTNGKIDLINKTDIIAISDLFRKTISGNKSLNSVFMYQQFAFIATGFGVIKFDMERNEFADTYFVSDDGGNIFVNDVTIFNDTIYAATVDGIRKAYLFDPQITFYESWEKVTNINSPDGDFKFINASEENLFTCLKGNTPKEDTLLTLDEFGMWSPISELLGLEIASLSAYSDFVLVSHEGFVSTYTYNWEETNRVYNYGEGFYVSANSAMMGKDNVIWIGDGKYGMVRNPKSFSYEMINPESPEKEKVEDIEIRNNHIWVATGGKEANWNNVFNNDGVYWRNTDLEWGSINKFQDTLLDGVFDIIEICSNPFNSNLTYGASLGGGLIEFDGYSTSQIFNHKNSALKDASDNKDWVGVTGLDFDTQGNLWMSNTRNTNPIAVYTSNGEWYSYNMSALVSGDLTGPILVSENDYKWTILTNGGKGILVFDDGGTLEDTSDDQAKILTTAAGHGGIPNSNIFSIAEDHDGEIWVGTSEGVGVFYSPGSVFTPGANFDAQQIIVEVNGYFQYLLGTETVTAIAIDGANRKWFGTFGSGVFLMSEDGTQQLHHFTQENSPLISNFIRTIEINKTTGEVLFGTNDGIIAYKGAATDDEVTTAHTYAYPNPVPQNYTGLIGIKGLAKNAAVRITDIAGNLVFESIAEGTQVVWDGNDMNGNRVATGVYLVFGIDNKGQDSQVAKILFTP